MANTLNEFSYEPVEGGRDVHVIEKQVPVKTGAGSVIFEILLWLLGIIPGVIFLFMKIKAAQYFKQLEQKIQHDASQIDNYLEQRVVILQNAARLIDKSMEFDKNTFTEIARHRSSAFSDQKRNEIASKADDVFGRINVAVENYPELLSHREIEDAMQQNSYLQKEITAARELYNDTVNQWNRDVYAWPTKMIVASRKGYTTRVPFIASREIKRRAREIFF